MCVFAVMAQICRAVLLVCVWLGVAAALTASAIVCVAPVHGTITGLRRDACSGCGDWYVQWLAGAAAQQTIDILVLPHARHTQVNFLLLGNAPCVGVRGISAFGRPGMLSTLSLAACSVRRTAYFLRGVLTYNDAKADV